MQKKQQMGTRKIIKNVLVPTQFKLCIKRKRHIDIYTVFYLWFQNLMIRGKRYFLETDTICY